MLVLEDERGKSGWHMCDSGGWRGDGEWEDRSYMLICKCHLRLFFNFLEFVDWRDKQWGIGE